jgi:hypothetical protein
MRNMFMEVEQIRCKSYGIKGKKVTRDYDSGKTTPQLGKTTPQLGKTTPQLGKTTPQLGRTAPQLGKASPQLGKASPQLGKTSPQHRENGFATQGRLCTNYELSMNKNNYKILSDAKRIYCSKTAQY